MTGGFETKRPAVRNQQQLILPHQQDLKAKNKMPYHAEKSLKCLLDECVAGEAVAVAPELGVPVAEARVWGPVFHSRQDFIELHVC